MRATGQPLASLLETICLESSYLPGRICQETRKALSDDKEQAPRAGC